MPDFKKLNLSAEILSALEKKGYINPTPIQIAAIPHLLDRKDLLGIAQTGTGKTAAFALPILDNLHKSKNVPDRHNIRALILTPTRELALQISDNIKIYGENLGLSHAAIFGGVGISNQISNIKKGRDIVIATPGRLMDLIGQGQIKFEQLEIFVLDEADRMLDMGFIHDVKKIISKLPKVKQTLLFSATMPDTIVKLADSILVDPVKIEITPQATTVEKIDQKINFVERGNKLFLLKSILDKEEVKNVLVFSKTKHGANRIVQFLDRNGVKVAAIHGNKSQPAREKALLESRQGKIKVLVATDIAARGIDIAGITHVINYDIPNNPENYVHRIGRTARAGREGVAISFCDSSELSLLRAIEKVIKFRLPVDDTHPFHGVKADNSAKHSADRDSGFAKSEKRDSEGFKKNPRQNMRGNFRSDLRGKKRSSNFGENNRRKNESENQPRKSSYSSSRSYGSKSDSSFYGDTNAENSYQKRDRRFGQNSERDFRNKSGEERSGRNRSRDFGDRNQSEDFGDRNRNRNFGDRNQRYRSSDNSGFGKDRSFDKKRGARTGEFNNFKDKRRSQNSNFKNRSSNSFDRDRNSDEKSAKLGFKGTIKRWFGGKSESESKSSKPRHFSDRNSNNKNSHNNNRRRPPKR